MAETFAFTNFYGYYIENFLKIWPHAKLIISELLLWVNKTMNMYGNMSRYICIVLCEDISIQK